MTGNVTITIGDTPASNLLEPIGASAQIDTTATATANSWLVQQLTGRRRPSAVDLSMLGPVFENKAVEVHHTATSRAAWDGPANERRVRSGENESYYRRIYAWNDPNADPTVKSAWSFIHHEVSGSGAPGPANVKACQSAIGVLNGARGGTTIPKADRQGVYDHLAAHLKDAGLEPPELQDLLQGARNSHGWYRIENVAPDSADLYIYDQIVSPVITNLLGVGISAQSFASDLMELRGKALNVHINSPGGSVFEGLAIYNLIRQHDGPVDVTVDGIAASIASVIAMAGDTVVMAPHSMLMIHEAYAEVYGHAGDMTTMAGILDKLSANIAGVYAERADKRINWRAKMRATTWITDQEAVAMGLADRIGGPSAPRNIFDLSRFRNVPEELLATRDEPREADADPEPPTKREIEQALRDAGMTAREAKAFVARGFRDEPRDDGSHAATGDERSGTMHGAPVAAGMVQPGEYPIDLARRRLQLLEAETA